MAEPVNETPKKIPLIEGAAIKNYEFNPRKITAEAFSMLANSYNELGDISGIVINKNTNEVVCGNQRTSIFRFQPQDIVFETIFETPTETGTVALGYIIDPKTREKFSIRIVDWTIEQCDFANLAANKMGGEFETKRLFELLNPNELIESGFNETELLNMTVSAALGTDALYEKEKHKPNTLSVAGAEIPITQEELEELDAYLLEYSVINGTTEGAFDALLNVKYEVARNYLINSTQ